MRNFVIFYALQNRRNEQHARNCNSGTSRDQDSNKVKCDDSSQVFSISNKPIFQGSGSKTRKANLPG